MQYFRRKPNVGESRLGLESLEARLNLSTLTAAGMPGAARHSAVTRIVGTPRVKTAVAKKLPLGGAATAIAGATAATTAIPVASYSAIHNSQLETVNGQPDIGYVSTNGAWVEYTVTAPTAGAYTLDVGLASPSRFISQVSVNGNAGPVIASLSTGAWQTYDTSDLSLRLNAGTNVIRFASLNGTQYNIGNMSLHARRNNPRRRQQHRRARRRPIPPSPARSSNTSGTNSDIGYVSASGATQDYRVNVATAGTYTVSVDAASVSNGMTFDLLSNGTKLTSFKLSNTWDWQTYTSYSQTVTLSAGVQTLEIASTSGSQYNLRSIKFALQTPAATPATPTTPTPPSPPLPRPLPPPPHPLPRSPRPPRP